MGKQKHNVQKPIFHMTQAINNGVAGKFRPMQGYPDSGIWESEIRGIPSFGILNPTDDWNPEFITWIPECIA